MPSGEPIVAVVGDSDNDHVNSVGAGDAVSVDDDHDSVIADRLDSILEGFGRRPVGISYQDSFNRIDALGYLGDQPFDEEFAIRVGLEYSVYWHF